MNLLELKQMLDTSVMRTDLSQRYKNWINRALRKIQQDRDWSFMQKVGTVTISAGQSSVSLPDDFKNLTAETTPVHVDDGTPGSPFPCTVTTRAATLNYKATTFYPSAPANLRAVRVSFPVYLLSDTDGSTSLNLPSAADQNLNFRVSYYAYLPNLEADSDTNVLTRQYEDMVESKVKAVAFAALNDPVSGSFETLYRTFRQDAGLQDEARLRQGRSFRMGG